MSEEFEVKLLVQMLMRLHKDVRRLGYAGLVEYIEADLGLARDDPDWDGSFLRALSEKYGEPSWDSPDVQAALAAFVGEN